MFSGDQPEAHQLAWPFSPPLLGRGSGGSLESHRVSPRTTAQPGLSECPHGWVDGRVGNGLPKEGTDETESPPTSPDNFGFLHFPRSDIRPPPAQSRKGGKTHGHLSQEAFPDSTHQRNSHGPAPSQDDHRGVRPTDPRARRSGSPPRSGAQPGEALPGRRDRPLPSESAFPHLSTSPSGPLLLGSLRVLPQGVQTPPRHSASRETRAATLPGSSVTGSPRDVPRGWRGGGPTGLPTWAPCGPGTQ